MAFQAPPTVAAATVAPSSLWNTYVRTNLQALGQIGARIVGTSGGFGERWYPAGLPIVGTSGTGTGTFTLGRMICLPIMGGMTLDRIAFEVTTGGSAGSVARVGIYQATSDTDLWPNALIVDGGEFVTTSTGIKSATINTALTAASLYWAVFLSGVAAPTIKTLPTGQQIISILGVGNTLGGGTCYFEQTQAYGALPSTFPSGPPTALIGTATGPYIGMRYSA